MPGALQARCGVCWDVYEFRLKEAAAILARREGKKEDQTTKYSKYTKKGEKRFPAKRQDRKEGKRRFNSAEKGDSIAIRTGGRTCGEPLPHAAVGMRFGTALPSSVYGQHISEFLTARLSGLCERKFFLSSKMGDPARKSGLAGCA